MTLFVLDIDDTLTKSENQHITAFVETMNGLGIQDVDQNWKGYKHLTDSFILKENYERNLKQDFLSSIIPQFEMEMTQKMKTLSKVSEIAGASSVLTPLMEHGDYAVSFATGSLLKPAFLKLDQAKILYQKDLVVGSNAMFTREQIVLESIERAKSFYATDSFENIISIGDGTWDMKTAHNLGLHFIGIGQKNLEDFRKAEISYHLKDWRTFDINSIKEVFGIN